MGRPSASKPHGMLAAGRPVRFAWWQKGVNPQLGWTERPSIDRGFCSMGNAVVAIVGSRSRS